MTSYFIRYNQETVLISVKLQFILNDLASVFDRAFNFSEQTFAPRRTLKPR